MLVNELYGPVLQGEGTSIGVPTLFLRLANCNLHCDWCDSKYTWDWKNYKISEESHPMSVQEVAKEIQELTNGSCSNITITGGEPMLQQPEIINLLNNELFIAYRGPYGRVEIETNGTQKINPALIPMVDQFNVSPKLSNNKADSFEKRLMHEDYSKCEKAIFKFVVENELDLLEIDELFSRGVLGNSKSKILLMPQIYDQDGYEEKALKVMELCTKYGYRFSPRLHVEMFGARRKI